MNQVLLVCLALLCLPACTAQTRKLPIMLPQEAIAVDTTHKTIHVFVALCDNRYQGIVPVPAAIGNGQDPDHNLYWGCAFGVRTYFRNSREWRLLRVQKTNAVRMERLVFRHVTKDVYLIADAYDGRYIRQCTIDFLRSCAGQWKDTVHTGNTVLGIGGHAKLVAYIGHDGLMDFQLDEAFANADRRQRSCMILACISQKYFAPHLKATLANPLVWSTGLMSPEAYTLHDALSAYVNHEPASAIRTRAVRAYARYQKCSERAAGRLLVTGW